MLDASFLRTHMYPPFAVALSKDYILFALSSVGKLMRKSNFKKWQCTGCLVLCPTFDITDKLENSEKIQQPRNTFNGFSFWNLPLVQKSTLLKLSGYIVRLWAAPVFHLIVSNACNTIICYSFVQQLTTKNEGIKTNKDLKVQSAFFTHHADQHTFPRKKEPYSNLITKIMTGTIWTNKRKKQYNLTERSDIMEESILDSHQHVLGECILTRELWANLKQFWDKTTSNIQKVNSDAQTLAPRLLKKRHISSSGVSDVFQMPYNATPPQPRILNDTTVDDAKIDVWYANAQAANTNADWEGLRDAIVPPPTQGAPAVHAATVEAKYNNINLVISVAKVATQGETHEDQTEFRWALEHAVHVYTWTLISVIGVSTNNSVSNGDQAQAGVRM
ncbi:hypothetical protein PROFUN_13261 [Planoprotostelium fungivorum]|uniref:Uncharacterized protein n=1 Tax=Planoprotostelium fungivorum TaxID=1890364 RepID=A0A2P6N4Y5_9EUKA|nr:hypothetical protein PROFUN_13261 [Planoprotostelium fungivorum]